MIPNKDWEWYGNAAHFICGQDCRFHMATKIGDYVISTVGQLWFPKDVRVIHAEVHDPKWLSENQHLRGDDFDHAYMERFGYEDIGCDRKFETMVFKFKEYCTTKGCSCGLPLIVPSELDFDSYNDAKSARDGHMRMCEKYAKKAKTTTAKPKAAKKKQGKSKKALVPSCS